MGCGTALEPFDLKTDDNFQYPLRAYGLWNSRSTRPSVAGGITFSTLCGPMGCGTLPSETTSRMTRDLSVPSAGLWAVEPTERFTRRGLVDDFQYPLRAYGLWNCGSRACTQDVETLSVPSAGLWAVEPPRIETLPDSECFFQYPLRAYGLWNVSFVQVKPCMSQYFQYPLRAYGLWNSENLHRDH